MRVYSSFVDQQQLHLLLTIGAFGLLLIILCMVSRKGE